LRALRAAATVGGLAPVGQTGAWSQRFGSSAPVKAREGVLVRKSSDLMSLLAHRGSMRRRSRSGFWFKANSLLRSIVTGHPEAKGTRRKPERAGLAAAVVAIGCIGVGYLLGNTFPWSRDEPGQGGLRASAPQNRNGIPPGPLGQHEDLRPLAASFFLTAIYDSLDQAGVAARQLRQKDLPTARPREFHTGDGPVYGVVVYFDGVRERDSLQKVLLQVEAPDATFAVYRKQTQGWPLATEVP
jgi:hypothetical protein